MSDICLWLESQGLHDYVSTFKKQKVDGVVLLGLDDGDLQNLGVSIFGDRKKIMLAIQTLRANIMGEPEPSVMAPPQVRCRRACAWGKEGVA